ncbi:MAG: hypothetical protein ACE5DQ_02660 [Candidatus Paceibacterota bacterium]
MRYPLVLDLETKRTFRTTPKTQDLGVSLVGVYDYKTGKLKSYLEDELTTLFPVLEEASVIIGFNIDHFDMPVLSPYYPGNISQFKTFDILADVKVQLGRRLSLNDLVAATLDKKKSGHGLQAIQYYKSGQIDKLRKYCLDDVDLTRKLFEFGVRHNHIFYPNHVGKVKLPVSWSRHKEYKGERDDMNLTLRF